MLEGVHKIPLGIREMAKYFTDERVAANRAYYSIAGFRRRMGMVNTVLFEDKTDAEWLTEYKGILAEMIVRAHLDMTGVSYWSSAIVKARGVQEPDVVVNDLKYEIKGGEKCKRINKFAYEKSDADIFIFIIYLPGNKCSISTTTREDIATWKLVKRSEQNQWYEQGV